MIAAALLLGGTLIARAASAYDPNDPDAALQRGCRTDGLSGGNKIFPQWVSVQAANPMETLTGVVADDPNGVHVAGNDTPFSHASHDLSFFVDPDDASQRLVAPANHFSGEAAELHRIEVEWESALVPMFVWPKPGDRVWVVGQHVFDCGHPPYRSEIHPPRAIAVSRTLPAQFPETGDAWRPAVRTDIWWSADMGEAARRCKVNALVSTVGSLTVEDPCASIDPLQVPNDRDLEFDIHPFGGGGSALGLQPGPGAQLLVRILPTPAYPSQLGPTTITPVIVSQGMTPHGYNVRVRLPLRGTTAKVMAASILVGWDKPEKRRPRRFRVSFRDIEVTDTLPAANPIADAAWPANFNVWLSANGVWENTPLGPVQKRTYNVNRSFVVTLFNGDPLQVWGGGYRRGCIDDWLGPNGSGINSIGDLFAENAADFGSLNNCHSMDSQHQDGTSLGSMRSVWNAGDFSGSQCPKDYGTDGPQTLSNATGHQYMNVHYNIDEIALTPEPVINVTPRVHPDIERTSHTIVTGDRFKAGEAVTLSLVDGANRALPLGHDTVRCGTTFYISAKVPEVPAGDYLVRADRSTGPRVDAPVTVTPLLLGPASGTGRDFHAYAFAANEPVTVEHWVMAERGAARHLISGLTPGKRVGLTFGRAPHGSQALSASANFDMVIVASATASAGANGSATVTLGADALPFGYGPIPPSFAEILFLTGKSGGTDFYVARGQRSGLTVRFRFENPGNDASAFWQQFTLQPNANIGPIDPVSLVSSWEQAALVGEGLGAVGVADARAYFEQRATNNFLAPLPSSTYAQLSRDAAALLPHEGTPAGKSASAALLAHVPAGAGAIRAWAEQTHARTTPWSSAERAAYAKALAPFAAAHARKDVAASRAALDALERAIPSLLDAAHVAQVLATVHDTRARLGR